MCGNVGITEQALRESHTHGQPEMNLRRRRCDPTAPEAVVVSSRVTAHRAASPFVSLSASQSRSTHCQTGRARRRHLRVREDIPATRDTHHTKQPPTDRREGGREGRKEGGGQGTPSPRRRGRKERPTAEPTQAGLPYRFVCCAARAEPTPTIRLRLRAASTPPPLRLLRRTFFAPHADSSTTDTSVAAT